MKRNRANPPQPPDDPMQHNATEFDVPANQRLAIEALVAGKNMTAAAQAAGVTRATLWRWMNKDADFQAALNSYKRELFEQVETQAVGLAKLAIEAVEKALREGDAKTGLAVLRGLGMLDGSRIVAPTDDVQELRLRQRRAAYARLCAEIDTPDLL
jgi:phage terminase small subunit